MTILVVPLTRGASCIVDDEDAEIVGTYKWSLHPIGYACRAERVGGKSRMILLHREILRPPDDLQCDHINGDKLDNRRCNLRAVTRSQNMANRPRPARATSPYRGVGYQLGRTLPWRARVSHTELGSFSNAIDAALSYDVAAIGLFGPAARTNFLSCSAEA